MILLADGFDHYGAAGTSRANMLEGVYASITSGLSCETDTPRSGSYALGSSNLGDGQQVRRVLPGSAHNVLGMGCAFYCNELPTFGARMLLCQWRDISNNEICSLVLETTGDITVREGAHNGTTRAQTTQAAITAKSYQHIEAFFTFAGASGAVEVRVNGTTVIDATNVDIGDASVVRQWVWGAADIVQTGETWIDDLYIYDDQGSLNNAIGVGDLKLAPIFPNQDTAQSDWTRNTGSNDFEAINQAAPDDDTTYISASMSDQTSEFDMEDTDPDAESIAFLASYVSARKTDAGGAQMRVGIASSNIGSPPTPAQELGSAHDITEVYTYYMDIFETDPATGAAPTPSAVDDMRLLLNRV